MPAPTSRALRVPVDELNRALFGLVVARDGDTVPRRRQRELRRARQASV
jgi:hypothetical protein